MRFSPLKIFTRFGSSHFSILAIPLAVIIVFCFGFEVLQANKHTPSQPVSASTHPQAVVSSHKEELSSLAVSHPPRLAMDSTAPSSTSDTSNPTGSTPITTSPQSATGSSNSLQQATTNNQAPTTNKHDVSGVAQKVINGLIPLSN